MMNINYIMSSFKWFFNSCRSGTSEKKWTAIFPNSGIDSQTPKNIKSRLAYVTGMWKSGWSRFGMDSGTPKQTNYNTCKQKYLHLSLELHAIGWGHPTQHPNLASVSLMPAYPTEHSCSFYLLGVTTATNILHLCDVK